MAFREVTREEFFAALNADKRDIMPTIVSKYDQITGFTSEWRTQGGTGSLFGKSDGNGDGNGDNHRYWLHEADEVGVS